MQFLNLLSKAPMRVYYLDEFGAACHVLARWQTLAVMCQRDKSQMTKVDGVRRKSCDPESFYIRTSLAP
jgi:hypothetical protein